jgi:hypothetical protein
VTLQRKVFWAWCWLTAAYWIGGAVYDGPDIILKFQMNAQGRWLHLALGILVATVVPLVVLLIGRGAIWIIDRLRPIQTRPLGVEAGPSKE